MKAYGKVKKNKDRTHRLAEEMDKDERTGFEQFLILICIRRWVCSFLLVSLPLKKSLRDYINGV